MGLVCFHNFFQAMLHINCFARRIDKALTICSMVPTQKPLHVDSRSGHTHSDTKDITLVF